MARRKHPRKQVEKAIRYAESFGWVVEVQRDRSGCKLSVNSSPRDPDNEAKRIYKAVDRCREEKGHGR